MEMKIGNKKSITEEEAVIWNDFLNHIPMYHSIAMHNSLIIRDKGCILCDNGSKPLHLSICSNVGETK